MKRVFSKRRWLRLGFLTACTVMPLAVAAKTSLQAKYPYDPACPWGRLSNGKGMLHRCLSEQEATQIAQANPLSEKKTAESTDEKRKPEGKDAQSKDALPKEVQLSVGPIEASEGDITVGALDKPMDRYKSCIVENGGLTASEGTVVVKFLVRAEAERAEGASVDTFQGMSEKAAKCVAYVVDRRRVGSPSAAVTGAKLHFKFTH